MIWAICVLADVSKFLDILTLEFSTTMVHLPFWLGCELILRLLLVLGIPVVLKEISMTFAAAICDADDPCSVNTAYDPESSFTVSPRSTTLPLFFFFKKKKMWLNSKFLRRQMSMNDWKCTVLPSFLALAITSFFVSDFRQLPCRCFLQLFFFHSLSAAALTSGICIALSTRMKLCTKL